MTTQGVLVFKSGEKTHVFSWGSLQQQH